MVALPHLAHLSAHPPNASSLILFPCSTVHLLFPLALALALHLAPQLSIPFFLHHSNADHIRYLIPPALPAASVPNHQRPPSPLLSQLIPQISSAHMVNLIHTPLGAPASSVRQQVVAAGNPNRSPFSPATDTPYQVARPLSRSKWNAKNYLTVNEEKTLS